MRTSCASNTGAPQALHGADGGECAARTIHRVSAVEGRGSAAIRSSKRGDAGGLRGQSQLAAGDEIELARLAPDFQHHGAERIAGQRVGGGPQRGVGVGARARSPAAADRGRVRASPLIDSAPDSISEKSCRTQTSGRRGDTLPASPAMKPVADAL